MKSKEKASRQSSVQEQKFKTWLSDTLSVIQRNPEGRSGILIAADSLSLSKTEKKVFQLESKATAITDADLTALLFAINQEDSIKDYPIELSFYSKRFYQPSHSERLYYDMYQRYDSILLINKANNKITRFNYIRGSVQKVK